MHVGYTCAIVREIPDTYKSCIKSAISKTEIDVNLAKKQHLSYCKTLSQLGLKVLKIEKDNKLCDSCFVEDTAIVIADKAIITRPGMISRRGEIDKIKKILTQYKKIFEIETPGTLDGGDVLLINETLYIGISKRTNTIAIKQVSDILTSEDNFNIKTLVLKNALHLKSVCQYLGNNYVIMDPNHFNKDDFIGYNKILVPKKESYAINCLPIKNKILIAKGYPVTKNLIEKEGFDTIEIDVSEFKKGDGGLTCLSIIF
jgi:dimethylargininase